MQRAVSMAAVLLALMPGCTSARRAGQTAPDVDVDTKKEILGRRLFDENCHGCHPGGEAGSAPAINLMPLPAELVRRLVRQGHGGMAGFTVEQMSENELDAIVEYVFTLRRGH